MAKRSSDALIPGNMEDRLLKEHLARLRSSWHNENCQQSRAANEVSTGVDRQRQAEERNQQLLREHHSYQQQFTPVAAGSVHAGANLKLLTSGRHLVDTTHSSRHALDRQHHYRATPPRHTASQRYHSVAHPWQRTPPRGH